MHHNINGISPKENSYSKLIETIKNATLDFEESKYKIESAISKDYKTVDRKKAEIAYEDFYKKLNDFNELLNYIPNNPIKKEIQQLSNIDTFHENTYAVLYDKPECPEEINENIGDLLAYGFYMCQFTNYFDDIIKLSRQLWYQAEIEGLKDGVNLHYLNQKLDTLSQSLPTISIDTSHKELEAVRSSYDTLIKGVQFVLWELKDKKDMSMDEKNILNIFSRIFNNHILMTSPVINGNRRKSSSIDEKVQYLKEIPKWVASLQQYMKISDLNKIDTLSPAMQKFWLESQILKKSGFVYVKKDKDVTEYQMSIGTGEKDESSVKKEKKGRVRTDEFTITGVLSRYVSPKSEEFKKTYEIAQKDKIAYLEKTQFRELLRTLSSLGTCMSEEIHDPEISAYLQENVFKNINDFQKFLDENSYEDVFSHQDKEDYFHDMRNEISEGTDQIFKYLTGKELETVGVSPKAFWDGVINMHIEETGDHDISDYRSATSTKIDLANNLLKEGFGEN